METNRIDFAFLNASKSNASKSANGGNAFADLLFGAMNQKTDTLTTGQTVIKPAETYAPRRRFDDYPLGPTRLDLHDRSEDYADRRVDNDQSRSRWSVTDDSSNPGRGAQEHSDHIQHPGKAGGHKICGEALSREAGSAVDAATPPDPATDVELPDSEQDVGLGEEGGAGDETAEDGSGGEQADLALTMSNTPSVEETISAPAAVFDAGAEVAAAGAGTDATGGAIPATEAGEEIESVTPALAAGPALPKTDETPENETSAPGASGNASSAAADTPNEVEKAPVTFSESLALNDTADQAASSAEGQAAAIEAKNERQLEEGGSSFRRNLGNNRRAGANGTGTAASPNNSGNANANANAASANAEAGAAGIAGNGGGSMAPTGTIPVGFDTGLGNSTGLPGWNLHLAQGAAARRGDFVANLRQHLQNLPVHDQVALSIQRSLRDGGGSITLQLSPTELGRIHLKLNIDEENNVQASVVVERPATLELLQRDMKALERALQDAGLKAGPGDLSFSLQGGDSEAFARDFGSGNGSGSGGSGLANDEGAEAPTSPAAAAVVATGDGWVDVQV
jgi:flagellar hook-length control protein FliK